MIDWTVPITSYNQLEFAIDDVVRVLVPIILSLCFLGYLVKLYKRLFTYI